MPGSEPLRQSVPTAELERYYHCGWAYVMPNFDQPNHSWVEWLSEKFPVYPANRVPGQKQMRVIRNERAS